MNKDASNYIFSTEGHIFKLDSLYRGGNEREKVNRISKVESIGSVTFSPGLNFSQVRWKFVSSSVDCHDIILCEKFNVKFWLSLFCDISLDKLTIEWSLL